MFLPSHKGGKRTQRNSTVSSRSSMEPDLDSSRLLSQSCRGRLSMSRTSSPTAPPLPPRMPAQPLSPSGAHRSSVKVPCPAESSRPTPPRPRRKHSWNSFSQTITGSLRIRKRRSISLKQDVADSIGLSKTDVSLHAADTQSSGGYFEALNQSVSCLSHPKNEFETHLSDLSSNVSIALNNTIHGYIRDPERVSYNSMLLNRTGTGESRDTSRVQEGDSNVSISRGILRRSTGALNLHGHLKFLSDRMKSGTSMKRKYMSAGGGIFDSYSSCTDTTRLSERKSTSPSNALAMKRFKGSGNLHDDRNTLSRFNKSARSTKRRRVSFADGKSDDEPPVLKVPGLVAHQCFEQNLEKSTLPHKCEPILPQNVGEATAFFPPLEPRPEPEGRSHSPPPDIPVNTAGYGKQDSCAPSGLNNLNELKPSNVCRNSSLNIAVTWYNIRESHGRPQDASGLLGTSAMPSVMDQSILDMSRQDFCNLSFQCLHRSDQSLAKPVSQPLNGLTERLNTTEPVLLTDIFDQSDLQSSNLDSCGRQFARQRGLNQTFTQGVVSRELL
ncbi:hypothetical protein PoB_005706300 [Plakobranchus ocellatus]|uniref:Uncharacterized protein n=1 Tax=Plakobranchus ocellatus TaxID=259542 RepID=A0AAV4CGC6_9GAST|nr:hypothetical protein PoB_005706300 [Plakobranchus ocellatus]